MTSRDQLVEAIEEDLDLLLTASEMGDDTEVETSNGSSIHELTSLPVLIRCIVRKQHDVAAIVSSCSKTVRLTTPQRSQAVKDGFNASVNEIKGCPFKF